MVSKKKIKGQKLKRRQLKNQILRIANSLSDSKLSAKHIIKKLKIKNHVDSVVMTMNELVNEGKLTNVGGGKYKATDGAHVNSKGNRARRTDEQLSGIVDMTKSGSAYILVEGRTQDIFVSPSNLNGAMNGDKVLINSWTPRGRRKPEGKVLKVIERSSTHFLGTIRLFKNQALLLVDNTYHNIDIRIPFRHLNGADDGDKAIVKVIEWGKPGQDQKLTGKVETNLGKADSNDVEMNAILINNGFNISFPSEVIEEANRLSDEITEEDIAMRRDFRKVITLTIDPDTAKDFDDALSVQKLENGNIEVGIHIADVTHFVKQGTELDKEAFRRSTSVYLVDRVAPMLPERLSNELCSLRPNEDKFTFSAVFEFDKSHKIVNEWFGKTLIHSDRRFTYEEAQEIIETGKGDFSEEVLLLHEIALKLRKDKFENGAISFESDEVKFKLDENGKPLEVYVKERKEAHMLVEDFMLLANKGVAIYIDKKSGGVEIPFIYRVHDEPDPDRIKDFSMFAKELGFEMKTDTPQQIIDSFNALGDAAKGNELLKMLEPLAIRTMAKAVYTTDNIGHYGLGFDFYAHFTSPIRRYADVMVHRVLFANLGPSPKRWNKQSMEDQAVHISAQERKAMTAERESIKYKSVEFMQGKEGEVFEANISGMIDKGIFVQLKESKAEGLILFSDFRESFELSESKLKAIGNRTKRVLKMGQEMKVRLIEADLHARQLDFEVVED